MKKILAVMLCLCCVLCLASCGDAGNGDTDAETTTKRVKVTNLDAVKADAQQGIITGVSIGLSASADDIKDKYEQLPEEPDTTEADTDETKESTTQEEHNHDTVYVEIHQGRDLTLYQCGKEQYFFVNDDMDMGVAVIAYVGDAYSFKSGYHTADDVEFSIGKPDKKDVPANDELFFLPDVPQNVTRLTYNFDNIRLDFIFVDNYLMSTVLTDTEVYTEFGDSAEQNTTEQGEE
ncbi:MAG: hypothetical protein IJF54_01820 [Clostridia bacterium]|nr:hypothetical protein [Clostridia bacterium]